jgi:Tfp pilus assembly protein PilW
MRASLRRIVRDEGGLTLVELLVVCIVSIIVIGVPLTLAVQAWHGQNAASSRGAATNRVELGLARLMQDLRSAVHTTTINPMGATGATLTVPVRSATGGSVPTTQQVVWSCTAGASCTRSVAGGTAFPVIPNLVSATFAPTSAAGATTATQTDPAYVQVTISVRDTNENGDRSATVNGMTNPITISDGTALRNFAL